MIIGVVLSAGYYRYIVSQSSVSFGGAGHLFHCCEYNTKWMGAIGSVFFVGYSESPAIWSHACTGDIIIFSLFSPVNPAAGGLLPIPEKAHIYGNAPARMRFLDLLLLPDSGTTVRTAYGDLRSNVSGRSELF